ncbi:hypothetical protein KP509_30G040900 [Ceratopteris richardii]|nr:hypothetical protein KP509_30G040900 [Ceratopteris richardii]
MTEPSGMTEAEMKPPPQMRRPGLGKAGRPMELLCNHFMVNYNGSQDVYHYDVSISYAHSTSNDNDAIANKTLCRAIMSKLYEIYGSSTFKGKKFAYDGEKCLFLPGPLELQRQEFDVILDESAINRSNVGGDDLSKRRKLLSRSRDFKVKLEYAAKVRMGAIGEMLSGQISDRAQDALRVLDIVLKQHAAAKGYLLLKDSYFSPLFGLADIGEGVQTCRGYHVSFRPSLSGLSLNLDIATTTVIKDCNVLDFIKDRFQPPNPHSIDWDKVKRVLKGIKVQTPHNKMVHRIVGFSEASSAEQKFIKKKADESGQVVETEMTIKDYYAVHHSIDLRFPGLPCIAAGRIKRPTYIPVELCEILPGQRYTKSLSSVQRQKMIDQARQGPEERRGVVQKAMDVSDYSSTELIRDFNIKIDTKMRKIPGRLLDTPTLIFGGSMTDMPRGGRWNMNNKSLAQAVDVSSWAVLNFDGRLQPPAVERIAKDLFRVCTTKGMKMVPPSVIYSEPRNNQRLPYAERVQLVIREVQSQLKQAPVFILCILPERKTSGLYGPLKKLLETKMSVITQCIAPPKLLKDQYLTNVALKINVKVGGYNSFLALEKNGNLPKISRVPTVIFGMDVSHGPPGFSDSPSIAAVVASREWPYFSRYSVRVRAQSRKVEMLAGLYEEAGSGGMIVELLLDFYNSCKAPPGSDRRPKQIIIFRDGVSESQFEQVLREEYLAFKKAFKRIDKSGDYDPKITLIVVQKRHHTRFFPPNGNVQPGTIVDASLCHPRDYDFYLCAHAGLIGTTRPTHYHVLVDENNFTVDELQQLTHALCYTYARSTTAVSAVTPIAYAHLAATHVRNFLDSEGGSETSSMTGRSERSTPINLPELHPHMRTKMFYC